MRERPNQSKNMQTPKKYRHIHDEDDSIYYKPEKWKPKTPYGKENNEPNKKTNNVHSADEIDRHLYVLGDENILDNLAIDNFSLILNVPSRLLSARNLTEFKNVISRDINSVGNGVILIHRCQQINLDLSKFVLFAYSFINRLRT